VFTTIRCLVSWCRSGLKTRPYVLFILILLTPRSVGAAQLGALLSPGPLAKAHQSLEGAKCQQCHEAGRKVSPPRCLTCHQPIAERMAGKRGVHRQVTECVSCHVEHAGVDGDLRHLDTRTFNHVADTGFALTGLHAKVATNCAACHKGRTFLDTRTTCGSCHADTHKGALGNDCTKCHSTAVAFKAARTQFDHSTARFDLTGAHQRVACEQCHKGAVFKGLPFNTCTSCHKEPHDNRFGATCTSCHTTERWSTQTVQHAKTRFPLAGAHVRVACTKCHTGKAMTEPLKFDRCSACHVNVHRDSIKDDCASCHSDSTFKSGKFDHGKQTAFALEGKHDGLACVTCHASVSAADVPLARKTADFSGAKAECVACHSEKDPHKGAFGRACDACHRTATFSVKEFRHPREPVFFAGQHQPVACEKCHVPDNTVRPSRATSPSMTCVSCHSDTHLGQLTSACEQCHAVDGSKFKAVAFSHERAQFPLTGRHETTECAKCHPTQTRAFPARTGAAVVFKPLEASCLSCHKDPHLGQVDQRCETCHTTTTFEVGSSFVHRGMEDFFRGFHSRYACKDCHKQERGHYPAGDGIAVRYVVGRTCAACHPQF
jgi:hypothetical protein